MSDVSLKPVGNLGAITDLQDSDELLAARGGFIYRLNPELIKQNPAGGDANLAHYAESYSVIDPASGPVTLNPKDNGHAIRMVVAGELNLTLDTAFNAGNMVSMTLIFEQDGTGGHAVNFPTATRFPDGSYDGVAQDPGAETVYTVFSHDGGNIWYAFQAGRDFAPL